MNLHFTFSVREISEIADDEQTLRIPMYLSVEWEVVLKELFLLQSSYTKNFLIGLFLAFLTNLLVER